MLRAADLFCGAGGSTTGAEASGKVKVVLAVNHWRTAIYSHQANHPETRHICAKIDDIDPRHDDLPKFDILMASPECTHHSIARGGRPVEDQKRATPWHVCAWAEACRPKWIVIENVREFRDWGPIDRSGQPIKSRKGETFEAWLNSLRSLGYSVEHQLLNAADFGEATKRIRLFVVARRGSGKIRWPVQTHAGRWRAAHEIIDWSRPCPSIFTRKRPLADKTLRRIEIGLRKFVGEAANPFIVHLRGTSTTSDINQPTPTITAGGIHQAVAVPFQLQLIGRGAGRTKSVDDPVSTIVAARENHGVVAPFLVQTSHTGTTGRAQYQFDPTDPLRTITTREEYGVAMPFLVPNFGERDGQQARTHSVSGPLPAVTGHGAGQVAVPYLIDVNHGDGGGRSPGGRVHDVNDPLKAVTTKRGQSLVLPFLTEYFGTGSARSVEEPLSTVTTKHRHGLAMVSLLQTMGELGVIDIGFRMLDVDELAAAQGFPAGYQLHGTKAEQIKQVGNAVCPGVMRALCSSIAEAA